MRSTLRRPILSYQKAAPEPPSRFRSCPQQKAVPAVLLWGLRHSGRMLSESQRGAGSLRDFICGTKANLPPEFLDVHVAQLAGQRLPWREPGFLTCPDSLDHG